MYASAAASLWLLLIYLWVVTASPTQQDDLAHMRDTITVVQEVHARRMLQRAGDSTAAGSELAAEKYPARTSSKPKNRIMQKMKPVPQTVQTAPAGLSVPKMTPKLKNLIEDARLREKNKQPFELNPTPGALPTVYGEAIQGPVDPLGFLGSPNVDGAPCAVRDHLRNGSRVSRPMRILLSTTELYVPTLLNWLVYYRAVCPAPEDMDRLFFLCFDFGAERALMSKGLRCDHADFTLSKNRMWLLRTQVTNVLLQAGIDVLISDLDALWLQNPFTALEHFPYSQLLASRASFPEEISLRLGATVCLGFAYVKSKKPSKALWVYLAEKLGQSFNPDDQRVLNFMLLDVGLRFPKRLTYVKNGHADVGQVRLRKAIKEGSGISASSEANMLYVTLLAHDNFRRLGCENVTSSALQAMRGSKVLHCLEHLKKAEKKEEVSRDLGTWLIRDDWKSVQYDAKRGFDRFLADCRITTQEGKV